MNIAWLTKRLNVNSLFENVLCSNAEPSLRYFNFDATVLQLCNSFCRMFLLSFVAVSGG